MAKNCALYVAKNCAVLLAEKCVLYLTIYNRQLEESGWSVLRFWEWQIRKHLPDCVAEIIKAVNCCKAEER